MSGFHRGLCAIGFGPSYRILTRYTPPIVARYPTKTDGPLPNSAHPLFFFFPGPTKSKRCHANPASCIGWFYKERSCRLDNPNLPTSFHTCSFSSRFFRNGPFFKVACISLTPGMDFHVFFCRFFPWFPWVEI